MTTSLYPDFIHYYGEYEKFLEEEKGKKPNTYCMTLFGISGAGKSTFLSRLKSSMTPKEFYESVINRSNEKVTVEDVTIGRSITSVTVVPKMHNIGNISIYDVPGFKDTDDNKKIIINILHKCLLTHVKHNKFIAVLKLDLIEEERMTQLIGDYFDSFFQLFGKNYRKNIDNVYFVITHFDKHNLSIERIIDTMKKRIYDAIDLDKDQLTFFLKRLVRKHIIVDYKNDTQEQLINKMSDLLREESNSIMQSEMTITNLDVYENDLNKKLKDELEKYITSLSQDFEKNWENLKTYRDGIQLYVKDKKEYIQKSEQIANEINMINEFLQNVDKTIDLISKDNDKLECERKAAISDMASQQVILDVFERTLKDEFMTNVRVDVAQRSDFSGYYIDNVINIDQSQFKERIILITRYEKNDDTLKTYLKTGGIIPDDIKKIKNFSGDIVLYNNNTSFNSYIEVKSNYDDSTKQLKISAKCNIPFKMYLYYTQELNNSLIFDKSKQHFQTKVTYNEKRSTDLMKQIEQNVNEIELLKLKDIDKRNKKNDIMIKHAECELKIKELQQNLNQMNITINDTLDKQGNVINVIKNNELYVTANKILKIFNKNHLRSSINDQVSKINKFCDESLLKFNNFRESVLLLQK